MSYLKDIVIHTHPVIFASQLYAETLNSTSISNHIKNVIGNNNDYEIVPYCYFHTSFMDYEVKKKNVFSDDLKKIYYTKQDIKLNKTSNIKKYIVPVYKTQISNTESKYICGMIGVPIPNQDDEYANQDHYVSFIYEKNKRILNYFDSSITKGYTNTETYKILTHTFNPKRIIVNSVTFETQGGVSDSEYNYIAQNIFCHTWSLWFLYNFVVKNKSMAQIDQMSSKTKGCDYDKCNLIKIKIFIYEKLLVTLKLEKLYKDNKFNSAFRYIIIDDEQSNIKEIIKL
jgi:hypothetical protein